MSRVALAKLRLGGVRVVPGCVAVASIALLTGIDGFVARLMAQARERVLYVSVYDSESLQPVKDLKPDGIVVREDGNRREVLRVVPATSPMPIAAFSSRRSGMSRP